MLESVGAHPAIVQLHGACLQDNTAMLVLEYMQVSTPHKLQVPISNQQIFPLLCQQLSWRGGSLGLYISHAYDFETEVLVLSCSHANLRAMSLTKIFRFSITNRHLLLLRDLHVRTASGFFFCCLPQGGDLHEALMQHDSSKVHQESVTWYNGGAKIALDVAHGLEYLHGRKVRMLCIPYRSKLLCQA